MREDRRRHYNDAFRRQALGLIRVGIGYRSLARGLAMPRRTARKWILLYGSGGEEAVMGGNGSKRYDWERKVAAARDHVDNGLDLARTMSRYGIASITPPRRWCREYRTGGAEALRPKPKGRPTRERVALLGARVAYLEKVRVLRASKSRDSSEAPSCDCSQGGGTGSTTC